MDEGFNSDGDIGGDVSSDLGSDAGGGGHEDFGGDLASDAGVDLNGETESADTGLTDKLNDDETGIDMNADSSDSSNKENVQEWLGDINPNFDPFDANSEYSNNCGSCSFAVFQRLEGDDEIVATADNIDTPAEMNEITGMEQVSMSPEEIQKYLISQGAGSHGIVGIDRAEGPGHWFNAYYDGEKVVAIDGQTGETQPWPPDYGNVTNWDISVKK